MPTAGTTFVIPDDTTFIAKAHAIVVGTVEGSYVNTAGADAPIETIYEIRVERSLKGSFRVDDLVRVTSPGGESDKYGVYVPGAASFSNGQRILLFLTKHERHWEPTDMLLGQFSFTTMMHGQRALVRGHDRVDDGTGVVRAGDKIRSEEDFIRFIERALQGRPIPPDYEINTTRPSFQANAFLRPVTMTYSDFSYTQVNAGPGGVRWPPATIAAGLNFARHTGCTGCDPASADTFITSGMGAWNGYCGSNVHLQFTGTTTTPALAQTPACGNACDLNNVIEFGDPNNHISGNWTGSGTIAVTTIVYDTSANSAGTNFRQLLDADIIFQDGYLPASESSAAQATTHELGHAIGWRHSNADPSTPNGVTENCNVTTAECAGGGYGGNAIMFWLVSGLGYALQPWDENAMRAVYPGGTCVAPSAPTDVLATATTATSVSVTWTASTGTPPITYQVQRSAAGTGGFVNVGSPTTLTAFTDTVSSASTAYLYRVVATNVAGSTTSMHDLATNVMFTDDPLVPGTTLVKAVHITNLRTAVDAVQTLAGQPTSTYTDNTITALSTTIKAIHLTELRSRLQGARTALGLATSYAETITAGATAVRASHFDELRNFMK